MITELKRTPITFDGKDGWEILILNDCPHVVCVCELCIFRDWTGQHDTDATCIQVHGCGYSPFSYFIFKKS